MILAPFGATSLEATQPHGAPLERNYLKGQYAINIVLLRSTKYFGIVPFGTLDISNSSTEENS